MATLRFRFMFAIHSLARCTSIFDFDPASAGRGCRICFGTIFRGDDLQLQLEAV